MKIKNWFIYTLVFCMLLSSMSTVFALEEREGADLVITDVSLSNPYFEIGDMVTVLIDITNQGDDTIDLGSYTVENVTGGAFYYKDDSGQEVNGSNWRYTWSRPKIFPGETVRGAIAGLKITEETVVMDVKCNSGRLTSNYNESNPYNNCWYGVSFSKIKAPTDLVIKDINVNSHDFSEGNPIRFEVEYENRGVNDIPYSSIDFNLSIGNKTYTFSDVAKVEAGETRIAVSNPVYITGDSITVYADINPESTVTEATYENNSFEKSFNSVKEVKELYTWAPATLGGGGYVRNGYVHPTIKDQVYMMSDVNGLYKYNFKTGMNEHLSGKWPEEWHNLCNVVGVAVDYNNANTVFMAGGSVLDGNEGTNKNSGVIRSFDGGKTWEMISRNLEFTSDGQDFCNSVIAIDPNNSNVFYAATARKGLWVTHNALDASVKWEQLELPGYADFRIDEKVGVTNVIIDGSTLANGRSATLYVSVKGTGIYKSTNGGESFELIENSPSDGIIGLYHTGNGNLVASGRFGVSKYVDGVWTDITPPYGQMEPGYTLTVNSNNPNVFAAAPLHKNEIYVSTDSGNTWKEILGGASTLNKMPWHPEYWREASVSFVQFDPFRNNALYYGCWFGAYRCEDVTANDILVTDITYGIEELCSRALVALPEGANSRLVYGTNDANGVVIDHPFTFPTVKIDYPTMQETVGIGFSEKNPNFVARVGGKERGAGPGDAAYSTDAGRTWIQFPTYPTKFDGVTRAQHGKVAVACDNNANGSPAILVILLQDDKWENNVAVESLGYVYRTDDLGESWTKVDSLPKNAIKRYLHTNEPLAADKVNKDVFYFYDSDTGNFYTSTNNGVSFSVKSKLPFGDYYTYVVPVAEKEGHVMVSIRGEGVFYSKNYGASFEKINGVETAKFFDIGAKAPCSDEMTLYVYGRVNSVDGVFRSIDLGKSWVKINDPSQQTLWNRLEFMRADRRDFGVVYITSHGGGIIVGSPTKLDMIYPRVGLENDINGKTVNTKNITLTGASTKPGSVFVTVNGAETECTLDSNNNYSKDISLNSGENTISIYAKDKGGKKSNVIDVKVNYDASYVGLSLLKASDVTLNNSYTIYGSVDTNPKLAAVYINDESIAIDRQTGEFSKTVYLSNGVNVFNVKATSGANTENAQFTVDYDTVLPTVELINVPAVTDDPLLIAKAKLSEPATVVAGGNKYTVSADNLVVDIPFALSEGNNALEFEITDISGNANKQVFNVEFAANEMYRMAKKDEAIAFTGTPEIDGVIDDMWCMDRVINKKIGGYPNNYGRYGLMSDKKNLYIAVEIFDKKVKFADLDLATSYVEDSIELYFDPELNRGTWYDQYDQQIRIPLGDAAVYACSKAIPLNDVVKKTTLTDYGYVTEIAIPWDLIYVKYEEGAKFGFEISVNDSSDASVRDGVICWTGDGNTYMDTSTFGTAYIGLKK